jgi:hypothetical protein
MLALDKKILLCVWVTIDGILDGILDLLTTLTQLVIHLIIATPLIYKLYTIKLSFPQPAVSSQDVYF